MISKLLYKIGKIFLKSGKVFKIRFTVLQNYIITIIIII